MSYELYLVRQIRHCRDGQRIHLRNIAKELVDIVANKRLLDDEKTVPIAKGIINIIHEFELIEEIEKVEDDEKDE